MTIILTSDLELCEISPSISRPVIRTLNDSSLTSTRLASALSLPDESDVILSKNKSVFTMYTLATHMDPPIIKARSMHMNFLDFLNLYE